MWPSSPRTLTSSWPRSLPGIAIVDVCVAHGATTRKGVRAQKQWWANFLDVTLNLHDYDRPLIALMDANARVGSTLDSSVGPFHAEPEDHAGASLRAWCDSHELALPQTFQCSCRDTEGYTWRSTVGVPARIDYIAVPVSWIEATSAVTIRDDDISNGALDHSLVTATVQVEVSPSRKLIQRRLEVIDRGLLSHPIGARILSLAMAECPVIPWHVHPDDHLVILNVWLRFIALACAPKRGAVPRKPWLPESTVLLVQRRAALRRALREAIRSVARVLVGLCLAAWREAAFPGRSRWPLIDEHMVHHCTYIDWQVACTWHVLRQLRSQLQAAVRADRTNYLRELAEQAQVAANNGDSATVYRICRRLMPAKARHIAQVRSSEGHVILDPYSARLRWLQHFSHVQQGALSSLAVLQQDAWVEAQASHASDPPIDLFCPCCCRCCLGHAQAHG